MVCYAARFHLNTDHLLLHGTEIGPKCMRKSLERPGSESVVSDEL